MATSKPKISVILSEEDKAAIEKIAEKQSRTVSNLVAILIKEYIKSEGYGT